MSHVVIAGHEPVKSLVHFGLISYHESNNRKALSTNPKQVIELIHDISEDPVSLVCIYHITKLWV